MKLRKNLKQVYAWTARTPTVVDLNHNDLAMFKMKSTAEFDAYLRQKGEFPVPALDIVKPRPLERETLIATAGKSRMVIVFPAGNKIYRRISSALAAMAPGVIIPAVSDRDFEFNRHHDENLIIIGGAHENTAAADLARWKYCLINALSPGGGGLAIQSVNGLIHSCQNIIIAAADNKTADRLLEIFRAGLTQDGNRWKLKRLDCVMPGSGAVIKTGAPNMLLYSIAKSAFPDFTKPRAGDTSSAAFDDFAARINAAFDSGGPKINHDNGHRTITSMLRCYYAGHYSGDRRFFAVFKKTLLGLSDYFLKTPGGASYPSDYDFYLGDLITCWSLAEADEIFSEADRLLITNLLLASTRMVAHYQAAKWPIKPNRMRFNHETFPALSLFWAARYFSGVYRVPDAKCWRQTARTCFSGPIEKVFKHIENSNSYQWIVPTHKLIYDRATMADMVLKNGMSAKTARLAVVTTDNFGYAAHFGDAEPITCTGSQIPLLAGVAALTHDRELTAITERCAGAVGKNNACVWLPHPGWGLPLWPKTDKARLPAAGRWETAPLDDHIRKRVQPDMPAKLVADKIALRSGWGDQDQYLLFEPYSCNSHIHYDMNSIAAYNHLGRMWLVDNGYGKAVNVANIAKAFATRERGPRDHNTLIFYDAAGNIVIPPPFAAITAMKQSNDLFLLESLLGNINGALWQRTIIVRLNRFVLIADRVLVQDASKLSKVECQFNALGKARLTEKNWMLEQKGIRLWAQYSGDGESHAGEYNTQGWNKVLGGIYPFARAPVKKWSRIVNNPKDNTVLTFLTLFEAGAGNMPSCRLDGLTVHGDFGVGLQLKSRNSLLNINEGKRMKLEFAKTPCLPKGLAETNFGACGPRPAR